MLTYQDYEAAKDKTAFLKGAITTHRLSGEFQIAATADTYDRKENETIVNYKKFLYNLQGQAVPDNWSANFKVVSGFFALFISQEVQHLLGNGAQFSDADIKKRLGKTFDSALQNLAHYSLVDGVSFGFFNYDHLEVMRLLEFVPFWDERSGALRAGLRYWRLGSTKPWHCIFYEEDGYTEFIEDDRHELVPVTEKTTYIQKISYTPALGAPEVSNDRNYKGFPIVPLWGNKKKQSEIIGLQSQIDAYDLIKSGFANDLDDIQQIYWILKNAGGMNEMDLAAFVERLHIVKAAKLPQNVEVESHTNEVPYQSRKEYLSILKDDLFRDAMAFDPSAVVSVNTATAIRAAYKNLDLKCDSFEFCVLDFLDALFGILADEIPGITEETVTFKRSYLINETEETSNVINAYDHQLIPKETAIKHLPFLTDDEIDALLITEAPTA